LFTPLSFFTSYQDNDLDFFNQRYLKYSKYILPIVFLILLAKIYYDTNTIEVNRYIVKTSSLTEALSGIKVAHLSDLHLRQIGLREKKVLGIIREQKPDLILLTGDYISFDGPYKPALEFFQELKAPLGVYAVMGNTEYYNENGFCILCHNENSKTLRHGSPNFLRNSNFQIKINREKINLIGVDDPVNHLDDLMQAINGLDPIIPSILLSHSPNCFDGAVKNGIDLMLSGHTHGGQVLMASYLQNIFPMENTFNMIKGFFRKGRTLMYVNKGLGSSFIPFRLGVKPEVAFFKFENPRTDLEEDGNSISITNLQISAHFAGFSMNSLWETFNFFNHIRKSKDPDNRSNILFDFESPRELDTLNWECHKWFEISEDFKSSGKTSLKVSLPPGHYPGINFKGFSPDWSERKILRMDIFNPSSEKILFDVRIDDNKSGWEYSDRFDKIFFLKKGLNNLAIPLNEIRTNLAKKPMNLVKIHSLMVFVINNPEKIDLYIDNIRLE
jgi:uncharacterized protein